MSNERFLQLADVADILNISASQAYALVRSGDLKAIQIGGRNQWRVERTKLEEYIDRAYQQSSRTLAAGQGPTGEIEDDDGAEGP